MWHQFEIGKIFFDDGSVGEISETTPLQSARSMTLSAMAVEYERFIYLLTRPSGTQVGQVKIGHYI